MLASLFRKQYLPCQHSDRFRVGTWLSLVEHSVRDAGVGGSNPLVPTIEMKGRNPYSKGFRPFCFAVTIQVEPKT